MKFLKDLANGEKGQALLIVLVILVFGGLTLPPLLGYIGTGLSAGQIDENKTSELYAADAGIEHVMLQIMTGGANLFHAESGTYGLPPYTWWVDENDNGIIDDGEMHYQDNIIYDLPNSVNGKSVEVAIQWINNTTFLIIAESPSDGDVFIPYDVSTLPTWTGTRIEAYVDDVTVDLTGILDHILSGHGTDSITILPIGNPEYVQPPEGDENGPYEFTQPEDWPTVDQMIKTYSRLIKFGAEEYTEPMWTILGDESIDSQTFRNGPLIFESGVLGQPTLTLEADVYITEQTIFRVTGNRNWTLNLNGHTIFIESDAGIEESDTTEALTIEQAVTLTGSGAIIAIGDIDFKPTMASSPEDYILVMSVAGETEMQPNGDFYGTLAGEAVITRSGNGSLNWNEYPPDLNIPGLITQVIYGIVGYEINQPD